MSKYFLQSKHKAMWMWLSKNPGKYPANWPGWKSVLFPPNYSFACQYAGNDGCSKCPYMNIETAKLITSKFPDYKLCYHGFYYKWITCTDLYNDLIPTIRYELKDSTVSETVRLMKHYAEKIAKLKVRRDISIRMK